MKFSINGIKRVLSSAGRTLKNISPEIAIVGGTVGLITAAVLACKETPKAMKVVDEHKNKIDVVEKALETGETEAGETYSEEDAKHDKVMIFVQDGLQLIKVYAPSIILAALSVASVFAGGKIFRNRITALTGAYALLENNFKSYRDGVIEKFGKDIDKELRYKTKDEVVEVTSKDENGKEKTELKNVKTTKYDGYSDYARIFDEYNKNWRKDGPRNLMFLEHQQLYANDRLRSEHVLFLNDVYVALGFPRTPEGQLVGWVWDPDDDTIDCKVDFGIEHILKDKDKFEEIMYDQERSFLLDFNCDGRILEKFTKFDRIV